MKDSPCFLTIRQTAATGIVSEHLLRQWQKQGRLPGIQTGNRFLVNYKMLVEDLQIASREAATQGKGR